MERRRERESNKEKVGDIKRERKRKRLREREKESNCMENVRKCEDVKCGHERVLMRMWL